MYIYTLRRVFNSTATNVVKKTGQSFNKHIFDSRLLVDVCQFKWFLHSTCCGQLCLIETFIIHTYNAISYVLSLNLVVLQKIFINACSITNDTNICYASLFK